MKHKSIKLDLLFDADEYRHSEQCPWTFFAYPTSLADSDGLPPDEDACRLLGEVQSRGIDVAIWVNDACDHTTYFACKKEDIARLTDLIEELESGDTFGEGFCATRTEELFAKIARDRDPGTEAQDRSGHPPGS